MPVSQAGVIQKSSGGGAGTVLSALLQTAGMIADISNQIQTLKLRREENAEQMKQFGVTSGLDQRQVQAQEDQLVLARDQLKNQQYQDAKTAYLNQQNDVISKMYGGSLKVWAGFNKKESMIRANLLADGDVAKAQEMYEAWRAAEPTPQERDFAAAMTFRGQFYLQNGEPTGGQTLSPEELAKARGLEIVDPDLVESGFGRGSELTDVSWSERLGLSGGEAAALNQAQATAAPVPAATQRSEFPSFPDQRAPDDVTRTSLGSEAETDFQEQTGTYQRTGTVPTAAVPLRGQEGQVTTRDSAPADRPAVQTQDQAENDRVVAENMAKLSGLSAESMALLQSVIPELRRRSAEIAESGDVRAKRLLQDFTDSQKKIVYTLRRDLTPEQKEQLQFMHIDGDAQAAVYTKMATVPFSEWNRVEQTALYPEDARQIHKDELEARRIAAALGVDIEGLKLQNSQQMLYAASLGFEEYWRQMNAMISAQGDGSEIGRVWTALNNLLQQQQDAEQFWEKEYGAEWATNKRVQESKAASGYNGRTQMINQLLPVVGFSGTFQEVQYVQQMRRAAGIPLISWGLEQVLGPKTSTGTRTEYTTTGMGAAETATADEAAAAAYKEKRGQ
jgi:hypothetical protein